MPDLSFTVENAEPQPYAATPLLKFKLRIAEPDSAEKATSITAIILRCQIRIEPARRRYQPPERSRLLDLFGEPDRWGQTLRDMLWLNTSVAVPPFEGSTIVDLPVPCSFDFNLGATKYFYALEEGEVPLCLLFSGTIFYRADDGLLQVCQIPWEKETSFRLPVQVWKDMMELYYPNSAWLCLRRDVFDRLYHYKSSQGIPTWEQALETLIESAAMKVES
jgi:hypothetical protein